MSDQMFEDSLSRPEAGEVQGAVRRLLDIAVALTALILLAPLLAAVALAIYVEGGRPIFFSQTRLGRGGRHFLLHKYRKFGPTGETSGPAVTVRGDPRMTRVGRFLEQTKLDELPQLWNILKGEMSLVGPRPESLAFGECFSGRYRRVLDHKPGLFGPCQVAFRNEGCLYQNGQDPEDFYRHVLFPLKARVDLMYFEQRSLFSDLSWVISGVLAVCGRSPLSCDNLPSALEMETRVQRLWERRA